MSDSGGGYNAVTYLLDRNVDAGRGAKVVFKDPVSEITYGQLQAQTRRLANLLKRLGVRRGDRLLRVNGVDVRAAGFEGVCDALRSASFPRCLVFSRGANR